jgi:GntR family transcriptional repressor for pyruvate dehydrogenase complex
MTRTQTKRAAPARRSRQSASPSLSALVAGDLRGRILGGQLDDGASLPKQSDLLAQYGVSLPTLREALRILECEGLLRVQRGKLGGSIVSRPTSATAAYAIATVLESNRVKLPDVAVALQEIEPACLAMAARRADRHRTIVPSLRSLNDLSARAIDDREAYRSLAYRLHREFIAASGSLTMTLLASALEDLWMSHATSLASEAVTRDVRRTHVRTHHEIIDAVERGDAELASERSREHLCEAVSHSLTLDVAIDSSTLAPGLARLPGR